MSTLVGMRKSATLLFPGVVAVCLSLPEITPGALAFDMRNHFSLGAGELGAAVSCFYLLSALTARGGMPLAVRLRP